MITLNIAGVTVGVDNRYPLLEWNCEEHRSAEEPLFTVSAADSEVQAEYDRLEGAFSLAACESNCLYRQVSLGMLDYDAFLLHAAVVAVDGEGYAFTAPGGTGKSTHARYWMQEFGDRAVMVNGDKPILRLIEDRFYVCGSPWRGKERLGNADMVPLKAFCLLERGVTNEIVPVKPEAALDKIFQQVLLPQTPELVIKQLDLLDKLLGLVPVYHLKCNLSQEAARVAYEGMHGERSR